MRVADEDEPVMLGPFLLGLSKDISGITATTSFLTSNLTLPQWHWTSGGNVWSVARCLDHLNRSGYAVLLELQTAIKTLKATRQFGSDTFSYNPFEKVVVSSIGPNSRIKIPVPAMFEPAVAPNMDFVAPQFVTLQTELNECVQSAHGLDLSAISIPFPVNGKLRLRLGAYLELTVRHEQYHFAQIEKLRNNPQFPRTPS